VTRSEEVRPPSPRQSSGKVVGAAKTATPRPRRANNGATSTARKPAAKKQPPTNGDTGEQPIVKPERVIVDVDGPTWAETMATLSTPEELDPDDIAILTGWTPSASAEVIEAPAVVEEPSVIEEPGVAEEPVVADHVLPELEPIVEPSPEQDAREEPIIGAVPALTTGVVAVAEERAVAEAVPTNPARAFTLWRRRRPRVRKVTRVVRRIDTWSVLKVSVLFYVVMFVILLVAGVLLWNLAESTGTVRNVEGFIRDLFNLEKFDVSGRELFRASWTLGVFLVIAGTGLNVTMAVLFNLISDLVGGIRVTVLEEEVILAPRSAKVTGRPAGKVEVTDVAVPTTALAEQSFGPSGEPPLEPPVESVDDA
jgi:hypothetical protein